MKKVILYVTIRIEIQLNENATEQDAMDNLDFDFNLDEEYGKVMTNDLQTIESI